MMHVYIQSPLQDAQKVHVLQVEEDNYLSMGDAEREQHRKAMIEKMHNLNVCCSFILSDQIGQ